MIIIASLLVSVFRRNKLYCCIKSKCIKYTIENMIMHSSLPSFLWVYGYYYSKWWSYVKQEWEADITEHSVANMV